MRQRDCLFAATAGLARDFENKLHVHGIRVTNRNRGLQPLEIHLNFAAKWVGSGFKLAEVEHVWIYCGIATIAPEKIMIAAELTAPRQFRLTEMPDQEPGPGEIQVRVSAVGICGSDMHYYAEGAVGDTPCVYPMVIGH